MLSRLRVCLNHRPRIREAVTIETWPGALDGLRAIRDFRVIGPDGDELATATSSWFLIDAEKRRPVRLPTKMDGFATRDRTRALAFASSSPVAPNSPDAERTFAVRRSDLDRVGR